MTALLIDPALSGAVPAVTILGCGRCASGMVLVTRPGWAGSGNLPDPSNSSKAVRWGASGADSPWGASGAGSARRAMRKLRRREAR